MIQVEQIYLLQLPWFGRLKEVYIAGDKLQEVILYQPKVHFPSTMICFHADRIYDYKEELPKMVLGTPQSCLENQSAGIGASLFFSGFIQTQLFLDLEGLYQTATDLQLASKTRLCKLSDYAPTDKTVHIYTAYSTEHCGPVRLSMEMVRN